jgi:hypothetical protein
VKVLVRTNAMYVCMCVYLYAGIAVVSLYAAPELHIANLPPPQLFQVRVCVQSTRWLITVTHCLIRALPVCSISRKTDCYLFVYKLTVNFDVRTKVKFGICSVKLVHADRHSRGVEILMIQVYII